MNKTAKRTNRQPICAFFCLKNSFLHDIKKNLRFFAKKFGFLLKVPYLCGILKEIVEKDKKVGHYEKKSAWHKPRIYHKL